MDLAFLWFILLGVLLAGYAVLDGFDLGVGILYPLVRRDEDRRVLLNAIGPVWNGNEVWLLTFGGAMFAAFPEVYATVFSGFYLPLILVVFALIFRGVSMEFRGQDDSRSWRAGWDAGFSLGSLLAPLLYGVAVGNLVQGLPVALQDGHREYVGGFFNLLTPYPLLVGGMVVALFALHGALYLSLKTEGALQAQTRRWAARAYWVFVSLLAAVAAYTWLKLPPATGNLTRWPLLVTPLLPALVALAWIPCALRRGNAGWAFLCSSCVVAAQVYLLGVALYPNLVPSCLDATGHLNIRNAASSELTLGVMAWIALLGLPLVLAYSAAVYWVFRGKVRLGAHSY